MTHLRRAVAGFYVALVLLACSSFATAQGIVTGSISGSVEDPQGAVVSDADVRVTQMETNRVFATKSSNGGVVQLPSLPPGTYQVVVEAKGFANFTVNNVMVQVGKDTALGSMRLKLGNVTESVVVEGTAPIIESTTDNSLRHSIISRWPMSLSEILMTRLCCSPPAWRRLVAVRSATIMVRSWRSTASGRAQTTSR